MKVKTMPKTRTSRVFPVVKLVVFTIGLILLASETVNAQSCSTDAQCLRDVCIGGVCKVRPATGGRCESNGQCRNVETESCIGSRCLYFSEPGEACDTNDAAADCSVAGSSCVSNICLSPSGGRCKDNVNCAVGGDTCINDLCVTKASPGGTCDDNNDCSVVDSSCLDGLCYSSDGNACSANSQCTPVSSSCISSVCNQKSLVGGPCDDSGDCAVSGSSCLSGTCHSPDGSVCETNSQCADPTQTCIYKRCRNKSSVGGVCDINDATADCSVSGSSCPSYACLSPDNGPCDENRDCGVGGQTCISSVCAAISSPNGPCDDSGDCTSPASCSSGTCLLPAGATCSANIQCSGTGQTCISGKCRALSGPTGPCDASDDCSVAGSSCTSNICLSPTNGQCAANNQCGTGQTCINSLCKPKSGPLGSCDNDDNGDCSIAKSTCRSSMCYSPFGATCVSNAECDTPLTCISTICQSKSSPGAPCNDGDDCVVAGSSCPSNTCLSPPNGQCSANNQCSTGQTCLDGLCKPKSAAGSYCDDSLDCQVTGSSCSSNICYSPNGATCALNSECFSPLSCISSICSAKSTSGGNCEEASDCAIAGSTCPSGRCLSPRGDACTNNFCALSTDSCVSGFCQVKSKAGRPCDANDAVDCAASGSTCPSGTCMSPSNAECSGNSQCFVSGDTCIELTCQAKASPGGLCDATDAADCSIAGSSCPAKSCLSPTGGSCSSNSHCASSADSCISGTCAPKSAPGSQCDTNDPADCKVTGSTCSANVCLSPTNGACSANAQCASSSDSCISSICARKAAAGRFCDTGDGADCVVPGSICTANVCTSPSTGSCSANSQCFAAGQSCISNVCKAKSTPGGACDDSDVADCFVSGSVCPNNICLSLIGSSCTINAHCASPNTCISNVCSAKSNPAGPCDEASDCAVPGSSCTSNQCISPVDGRCTSNSHCAAPFTCIASKCKAKSPVGGYCDINDAADCSVGGSRCPSNVCLSPNGGSCNINTHCFTTTDSCISNVCTTKSSPGGACDLNDQSDCAFSGSTCPSNFCQSPANGPCTNNNQCYVQGQSCLSNFCKTRSAPGGLCDLNDSNDCSVVGSTCPSGRCLSPGGGSCSANGQCFEAGQSCIVNVCRAKSSPGGVCDANDVSDCSLASSKCPSNRCLSPSAGSCSANNQCWANGQTCISSICSPKSATGKPCDDKGDCSTTGDVCTGGICV